jgi:hypothetical protein
MKGDRQGVPGRGVRMMSAIKTPNRRSQTPFSVCNPRDLPEILKNQCPSLVRIYN